MAKLAFYCFCELKMSTIKYSLPLRNFYGGHHYISCIKILTVTEQHLLNVCMCASAIIFEKVERRDSIYFVFVWFASYLPCHI